EIVLAAVTQSGSALFFADVSLRSDRDFVLSAVAQNGGALGYADASLKRDREIVLTAVKQDGMALRSAADSLKRDHDVVLAAVTQNCDAAMHTDKTIGRWAAASKSFGEALTYEHVSKMNSRELEMYLAALRYSFSHLRTPEMMRTTLCEACGLRPVRMQCDVRPCVPPQSEVVPEEDAHCGRRPAPCSSIAARPVLSSFSKGVLLNWPISRPRSVPHLTRHNHLDISSLLRRAARAPLMTRQMSTF
ncbi:MAG: DUF4116 domain-containing protein, partial [Bacteroidota bacterium]